MSPSPARDTKPARFFGVLFSSLAYLALFIGPSCSNPEPQVIARFPGIAGASTGGAAGASEVAGGAGGLDAGSGEGGTAGSAPLSIQPQRGRVKVVDGKLVTDVGTPLRGLLLPVDTADWALTDFELLHTLAQTTGLNAVHVYLENSGIDVGSKQAIGDALVALAAEEGLYVVIGYGTGVNLGTFDSAKLKAFWTLYAGRYGGRSHVVFEIQNDPDRDACRKPLLATTLAIEQQVYTLIRSKAPDTHVLMFSTTNIVQPSVLSDAVTRLGAGVDWSNASFAVGASGTCLTADKFSTLAAAANTAGVALTVSQLPRVDDWQPFVPILEQERVGWLQFRWFGNQTETLQTFVQAVTKAGLSWCPERGTFPEDSSTCR